MPVAVMEALPRQSDLLDVLALPDRRLSVLYGGAMGGGKSHGIAIAGLLLSHWWPNNRGFIGRLDFKDLRETTYQTCIDVWGATGLIHQHHKAEHWVRFKNGSHVLFGELKDPESRKSLNLGWFAIDEATEVPEASRLMLLSRLRWPGVLYREVLASNPGPGWVKREFYEEPRKANRYFVPSLPNDNAALPDDYVAALEAQYPEIWIKRYLRGSWDAFEGQVFDEWDATVHKKPAVDQETSARWRPRIRSIDHGLRNPTCCLWLGVDSEGVIHVYDEHYLAGQPVSVHAAAVSARGLLPTVIDPSTQAVTDVRNGTPWSVKLEYQAHGVPTEPANNARMAGIIRVKEMLRAKKLVVHENCVNLLRELPEYEWKDVEGNVNPVEDATKKNDHAVDALRYGVVALRGGAGKRSEGALHDFEMVA
jgi:PBSX family phage terminase large subunit